jgi:hypothetical protein
MFCLLFGAATQGQQTKTYVFVPDQSTVYERNYAWGYTEETYGIEGEFELTVDDFNGVAWFDRVDANLSEDIFYVEGDYKSTSSLDVLFHMTELEVNDFNYPEIDFLYEKNYPTFPDANVRVTVNFSGDSVELTGSFSDDCFDCDEYDLEAVAVLKKYCGGLGDANHPYLICDANQLNAIGADPNDWDKHFKLVADINLADYNGTQFNITAPNFAVPFTGIFDGNNHSISSFTYECNNTNCVALFGYVDASEAAIKNLVLIVPDVNALNGSYVGSLVGYLRNGTLTNCRATNGDISAEVWAGGLVGRNVYGCILQSSYQGNVSAVRERVGGLAGENNGNVSRCSSAGNIVGNKMVGGLVGLNYLGEVFDSYSKANVVLNEDFDAGGLVGNNTNGHISNCYSTGAVSGEHNVGGLLGSNMDGTVSNSFWDVNSSGLSWSARGTGKTTAEMQTESTFTDAGWDFVDVWNIGENQTYPFLRKHSPGDLNHDGVVDWRDFAILASRWLEGR